MPKTSGHIPVLLNEVIFYLNPGPGENFIDCTLGGGGHALAILEKTGPDGKLLGIDLDENTAADAAARLAKYGERLVRATGNFADLKKIVLENDFQRVRGILLDIGLSSMQLAGDRGFSFLSEERLDMRFSTRARLDAYKVVNSWPAEDLEKIIKEFGEERFSRPIVKKIVEARRLGSIATAKQLGEIVSHAIPRKFWPTKIHPATKTFQAIRMAVNGEIENLERVLPQAVELLEKGGRLAVITFHSLEDRIVKHFFKKESKDCHCPPDFPVCRCDHRATVKLILKDSVEAGEAELAANPRSRSARLRVVEKIR